MLRPTNKLQNDCHSRAEPAPVKMGAGVQCKDAWIPACAGLTGGQYSLLLNIILENTSSGRIAWRRQHRYRGPHRILLRRNCESDSVLLPKR
jgi:hypothetical protein